MKQLRIILSLFLPLTLSPLPYVHAAIGPNEPYVSGWIPNFGHEDWVKAPYHIIETNKAEGNWLDSDIFTGPVDEFAVVRIKHKVTFNAAQAKVMVVAIYPGAELKFATNLNTRLEVTHLLVHKSIDSTPDGYLEIGTELQPVESGKKAEVVFRDMPMNTMEQALSFYDPGQYGNGLIVLGKWTTHGKPLSATFVRLAAEPMAGHPTLSLDTPVTGWEVDDRIVIPDTRHLADGERNVGINFVPQWEERTLALDGGSSLSISPPLSFNHIGARDGDGNLDFLPHVANLTRNVVFTSENPNGVRGHTLTMGRADMNVNYTQFQDLGRTTSAGRDNTIFGSDGNRTHIGTNQDGRHPIFVDKVIGPINSSNTGHQFRIKGCSVNNNLRWAIRINDSFYGLIQDNTVYQGHGALYMTKRGAYNEFVHNFGLGVKAYSNPRDWHEPHGEANDGGIFWFWGFHNYIRDNVATNAGDGGGFNSSQGFNMMNNDSNGGWPLRVPLYRGADVSNGRSGIDYQDIPPRDFYILEFSNNEAYGGPTSLGLLIWELGAVTNQVFGTKRTIIKNFHVWHVAYQGCYNYPIAHVTFDGLVVRGNMKGGGFRCGDYQCRDVEIVNSDFQRLGYGLWDTTHTPDEFRIRDSFFKNVGTNIYWDTQATPGGGPGSWIPSRKLLIDNVRFVPLGANPLRVINMVFNKGQGTRSYDHHNYIVKDEVFVTNYNGTGQNFRVFWKEQAPTAIVPQTSWYNDINGDGVGDWVDSLGSPDAGKTNAQNWVEHGIAIAGAIAPCLDDTSHPEIIGFVCPMTADSTPPSVPQNLSAQAASEFQVNLSWVASTDVESGILNYNLYRDGALLKRVTGTSTSDTGLLEGQSYTYEVSAVNIAGLESAKSAAATATTRTDTAPPILLSASAGGDPRRVVVSFSEPVDETTAENIVNYVIDNGISVSAATLNIDPKFVTLTTSNLSEGVNYTLTISNVKDRARTPNIITPNSQKSFTYSSTAVGNQAPSVNVGLDRTVALPNTLTLSATVSDDGQLNSTPTLLWTQDSGPNPANFSNDSIEDPMVTFPVAGVYVLKLAAFDGELETSDTVTITVTEAGSSQPEPEIPKFKNILNPTKGDVVSMSVSGDASVDIYTKSGSLVRRLKDNGSGSIDWDGRNEKGEIVSSGVYLWKIKLGNNGDKTETRKVVVLK